VNIFFDEDTGGGVSRALRELRLRRVKVEWPRNDPAAPVKKGTFDEDWIPWVGEHNFLLFSCNTDMLSVEAQFELLRLHGVGAVFLSTGQEQKLDVLRLVLNEWEWLVDIWEHQNRPFIYRITINGKKTPVL
jgi:hypothetical protein